MPNKNSKHKSRSFKTKFSEFSPPHDELRPWNAYHTYSEDPNRYSEHSYQVYSKKKRPPRSDDKIYENVCDRLNVLHDVDTSDIQATVRDAEVTLKGTVASRYCKQRAEEVCKDILGVNQIKNNLRVSRKKQK